MSTHQFDASLKGGQIWQHVFETVPEKCEYGHSKEDSKHYLSHNPII